MSDDTARARRNLKSDDKVLIANARNDITIANFTTVLRSQDDTLLQKGSGKGLKLYDEVARDGHVHSVLQKRAHHLVAREWVVEPGGTDAIDEKAADFVREVLAGLNAVAPSLDVSDQRLKGFDQLTLALSDATLKGYAIVETVWARDGANIVPDRLVDHDQRRFVFDHDWRPRLLTYAAMSEGVELPRAKFIVHRHGAKGNDPYGLGLGSKLFWPVLFKREGVAFWLRFMERFAQPIPVGKYPIGMLERDQQLLLDRLEALAAGAALMIPIGTEIDTLEAKRAGDAGYENWCRYWDEQISETVLGETLTTNIRGAGSRAASETHSDMLDLLVDADGDLLTGTLSGSLIAWLTIYNFPGAKVPQVWRPRPENEAEIEAAAKARAERRSADLKTLKEARAAGFEPRDLPAWIDAAFGCEMTAVATPPPAPADGDAGPAAFAESENVATAALLESLEAALAPIVDTWIDDIGHAIRTDSAAPAALLDLAATRRLAAFAEILGDALALAELMGRSDVLDELDETVAAADPEGGKVVFKEQLEFFRQKVRMPTNTWTETLHQAHDRAFVVAGATSDALLTDFHDAIATAIESGATLDDFRKDFDRIVAAHDWSYKGARGWRSRVIFETNIRTSHMAGRLKQMRDPEVVKVRPYWEYVHAEIRQPKVPREQHLAWDGLILLHDDPWWGTHYPMNDFGCSCGVRTRSKRDLTRLGKSGPDKAPEITFRRVKDPTTGEMVEVPEGIGFGWAYQPGDTWERGVVPRELQRPLTPQLELPLDDLKPLTDLSRPFKAGPMRAGLADTDYVRAFLSEFGADLGRASLFRDRAGQAVVASEHLFKNAAGAWKVLKRGRELDVLRLAETIKDPDEIWIDWAAGPDGTTRLVRRYLRGDAGTKGFVAFEWSDIGWHGLTALTPTRGRQARPDAGYLEKARRGVLLYRRSVTP